MSSARPAASMRYPVSQFKTSLGWGVKDRAGEWLRNCVTIQEAKRTFAEDQTAFQLITGCDPWACLDDSPVTLVVVKENSAALQPRPPEEY